MGPSPQYKVTRAGYNPLPWLQLLDYWVGGGVGTIATVSRCHLFCNAYYLPGFYASFYRCLKFWFLSHFHPPFQTQKQLTNPLKVNHPLTRPKGKNCLGTTQLPPLLPNACKRQTLSRAVSVSLYIIITSTTVRAAIQGNPSIR